MPRGQRHSKQTITEIKRLKASGKTIHEIADQLGIPSSTVWAHTNPRSARAARRRYNKRMATTATTLVAPRAPSINSAISAILASNVSDTQKLLVIDLLVS